MPWESSASRLLCLPRFHSRCQGSHLCCWQLLVQAVAVVLFFFSFFFFNNTQNSYGGEKTTNKQTNKQPPYSSFDRTRSEIPVTGTHCAVCMRHASSQNGSRSTDRQTHQWLFGTTKKFFSFSFNLSFQSLCALICYSLCLVLG